MAKKTGIEKPITIGSVVQLKSGGPLMTVIGAVSGASVVLTVVWAIPAGNIQKADIALQAFRRVK